MKKRLPQISFGLFVILLLLSHFEKSMSGDYWESYAFAAFFTLPLLVMGPRWYRISAIFGLLVVTILIFNDVQAGRKYREKQEQRRRHFSLGPAAGLASGRS